MRGKWRSDYLELNNEIQPMKGRTRAITPRPASSHTRAHLIRPCTAPETLSVNEVSNLVSRLYRPNTATGRKAVLWSQPRQEWEENYTATAILFAGDSYKLRYGKLQKHYPGTWTTAASGQEQCLLNERLSRPTMSSAYRAGACGIQRRYVERFKAANIAADIAYKKNKSEEAKEDDKKPQSARSLSRSPLPLGARENKASPRHPTPLRRTVTINA